jgi:acyl-CoA thioesterase
METTIRICTITLNIIKEHMTPQARAEKSASIMWSTDFASQKLGIQIDSIAPGFSKLSMPIQRDMLNGIGICHGGFIFTLADSALAFASNSYNVRTVAQQLQITYVQPVKVQDILIAVASEITRTGRSATYDVNVTCRKGHKIALLRGLTRTIKGQLFNEDNL